MIVSAVLCYDCHERYETGKPAEGSDAVFFPNEAFDPLVAVRCPRCGGRRVSVTMKPDPSDEPKSNA